MSTADSTTSSPGKKSSGQNEDELRKSLRQSLQSLSRREPLEPTYKRLILNGAVTSRRPVLVKDKFYRRVGSRLRERVEGFLALTEGKDPYDRISQRKPLEDSAMRAALTLREAKEHEQQALLDATLAAMAPRSGMDEATRKKHFEGIALTLVTEKKKTLPSPRAKSPVNTHAQQTEVARQQAELERQRAQARAREAARRRREEEERQRAQEELARKKKAAAETPEQALHKLYGPMFKKLWDMEFVNLNSTNPFRIVIDRGNCAAMGAADYFDVIKIPMNLTYIKEKVDKMEYKSLKDFFDDVELMISNALLYNSDVSNPYRVAAEDMKKRYQKMAKKVVSIYQKK